jgi:hypothetical protein
VLSFVDICSAILAQKLHTRSVAVVVK